MYKLLVVDDENELRNGLCNYFSWAEIGFDCLGCVEDGHEALDYIQKHHVDVLLSDIVMPIMNGIDLAKEIYDHNLNTKIVFLSGYKDFEYAQQALSYGVKNYILKPTKHSELTEVFLKLKKELDLGSSTSAKSPLPEDHTNPVKNHGINDKIINTIKNYVLKEFRDVTLENAAALVHMHPFYISKIFKQKTGQNFSDFLMDVRMKKAADLLMDINYKTYEVSEIVGYSNSKNFTRTFKSYFGLTPREYRNANTIG